MTNLAGDEELKI